MQINSNWMIFKTQDPIQMSTTRKIYAWRFLIYHFNVRIVNQISAHFNDYNYT